MVHFAVFGAKCGAVLCGDGAAESVRICRVLEEDGTFSDSLCAPLQSVFRRHGVTQKCFAVIFSEKDVQCGSLGGELQVE